MGRGEYFSEKSTFLHGPRKWPCKRLQQYLWEQYVTPTVSLSPQLYHCFYCHMLYDGNGQGWGAYWNLTPTVAPLYMMRYWSGIVNFGWLISIRCTGSDQSKMWYALLLAVISCFGEVGHIYGKMGGGIFTEFLFTVNMPPLKSSPMKPGKSMLFFHIWNANFSVTSINSQMYMTKPKQAQKKLFP